MKPFDICTLFKMKGSPPARGRGLKPMLRHLMRKMVSRPPRGGVD